MVPNFKRDAYVNMRQTNYSVAYKTRPLFPLNLSTLRLPCKMINLSSFPKIKAHTDGNHTSHDRLIQIDLYFIASRQLLLFNTRTLKICQSEYDTNIFDFNGCPMAIIA